MDWEDKTHMIWYCLAGIALLALFGLRIGIIGRLYFQVIYNFLVWDNWRKLTLRKQWWNLCQMWGLNCMSVWRNACYWNELSIVSAMKCINLMFFSQLVFYPDVNGHIGWLIVWNIQQKRCCSFQWNHLNLTSPAMSVLRYINCSFLYSAFMIYKVWQRCAIM